MSQAMEKTQMRPGPLTDRFLALCQRVLEFLREQKQREMSNLPLAESLEKMPGGGFCLRKQLPIGVIFLAHLRDQASRTVSLRIFFDPRRFRDWYSSMGPMSFLYMDPYGLELILDEKSGNWRLYLDRKELYVNLETDDVYELAQFEILDERVLRTA